MVDHSIQILWPLLPKPVHAALATLSFWRMGENDWLGYTSILSSEGVEDSNDNP